MKKRRTHEDFLIELKKNNKKAYDALNFIEKYVDSSTKILAETKYGLVKVNPSSLLIKKSMPSIKNAINKTEYWKKYCSTKRDDGCEFYIYDEFEYVANNKPAKFVCPIHGVFKQTPSRHISNSGCQKCNGHFESNEEFLLELNRLNPYIFEILKIKGKYIDKSTKILCSDKYGDVLIRPRTMLLGIKVDSLIQNAINKTEYLKEMFKDRECSNKIIYDKFKYNGYNNVSIFECCDHGIFYQTPVNHLISKHACPVCRYIFSGENQKTTTKEFILESRLNQKTEYGYEKTRYVDSSTKVTVTCQIHGDWDVMPYTHKMGICGCPECAREIGTYNKHDWIYKSKKSKNFDSYKVYKIMCWDKKEIFYKIGITYQTVGLRFANGKNSKLPYDYEIIEIIESEDGEYIWGLEKELHRQHKEYKYIPSKEFGGMYECFTKLI